MLKSRGPRAAGKDQEQVAGEEAAGRVSGISSEKGLRLVIGHFLGSLPGPEANRRDNSVLPWLSAHYERAIPAFRQTLFQ
jgi:hypothetical protein